MYLILGRPAKIDNVRKIESNENVGMGKNSPFLVELINEDEKHKIMKDKFDYCKGKGIKIGLRHAKTPNQRLAENGKKHPAVKEQRNQSNPSQPKMTQDVDEKRNDQNKKKTVCRDGENCFYIIDGIENCRYWHKPGTKFTPKYNESRSFETYTKNSKNMAPSSSIPPWTFGTFSQSIPVWNQFDASQSFNTNLPRVPLPTSIPNRSQEAIQYIPTWNQQSTSQSTNKSLSPIGKDPLNQSNENNDMTLDVPAKSIDEMLKNVIGNSSRRYDQQLDKTKMSLSNS